MTDVLVAVAALVLMEPFIALVHRLTGPLEAPRTARGLVSRARS